MYTYILFFTYFRKEESGREGKNEILPREIEVNLTNNHTSRR
jgi:hypothetical protein